MKIKRIIIGLEVHVELKTASKMFCSCNAEHFEKVPNSQTCPVCLGLPGALPVPNKKAIEWTLLLGLALGGKIQTFSRFDRKNYFYPDLPKGYQISQYQQPFILGGKVTLESGKEIRIERIHLEEDTAKLLHEDVNGEPCTLIDFNRSGVALAEIVSEPDMTSSDEAKDYLETLQKIIQSLGISDADMEKGMMRCEPTVNLEISDGKETFYTPLVELKNINSFRFVKKAIDFEVDRQFKQFQETKIEKQKGNKTTRGWDEDKGETFLQRAKEEANDYRYFPEPDIPPIEWSDEELKNYELRIKNYESPKDKKIRYETLYGLSPYQSTATIFNSAKNILFDETVPIAQKRGISLVLVDNVIINEKVQINTSKPIDVINYIESSKKQSNISEDDLDKLIEKLLSEHPEVVESYKKGKVQALGMIVGLVKKETGVVIPVETIIKMIK